MSVAYQHKREISLSPFVPDPDPNSVEPDSSKVFALRYRPPSGQTLTTSHALFVEFDPPVPAATLTFVTWERDALSGRWTALPQATAQQLKKQVAGGEQDADIFVQALSVAGQGGATRMILHVAEQGTNESVGYGGTTILGTVTADQGIPNTNANGWPVKLTDGVDVLGTVAHPVQVSETSTPAGTSTVTDVPASVVAVTLLTANASRIAATIFNDSNKALTLKLGAGVTSTSRTTQLPPKSEYTLPARYTGIITGFWDAGATGSAAVTDLSP